MKNAVRRTPGDRTSSADDGLRNFADSRGPARIDPDIAVAEALAAVTGKVSVAVDGNCVARFVPAQLFQLTFANPQIGLTDGEMPLFLRNLAVLFDSQIAARMLDEVAPVARQRIGLLSDLIRMWQRSQGA